MGYPQGHKEQTRQKIIQAAQNLWKVKGYDGASVDMVMKEAGLTRGGFYAHFKSKDDLLCEVLKQNRLLELQGLICFPEDATDEDRKRTMLDWYLSTKHRDAPEIGCPLTALSQETQRLGGDPKEVMTHMIEGLANWVADEQEKSNGLAAVALMVGAVTLSRTSEGHEISEKILTEARQAIDVLLSQK